MPDLHSKKLYVRNSDESIFQELRGLSRECDIHLESKQGTLLRMAGGDAQPLGQVTPNRPLTESTGADNCFVVLDSWPEAASYGSERIDEFIASDLAHLTLHLRMSLHPLAVLRRIFWLRNIQKAARNRGLVVTVYGINSSALVEQVITESGYVSNKFDHGHKASVKKLLWGATGYRYFCPLLLVLISKQAPRGRLTEVARRIADTTGGTCRDVQYILLLANKLLASLRFRVNGRTQGYIAIISQDERMIQGRKVEKANLTLLDERNIRSSMAPKFICEGTLGRDWFYVTESVDGVVFDLDKRQLGPITKLAARQLIAITRDTKNETVVDSREYRNLVGYIFDQARINLKVMNEELNGLEEFVKQTLLSNSLPSVLFHGDFKIENVVFSSDLKTVNGIIDWEFSRIAGLPYLDLWYLISYNRVIRGAGDITGVFFAILLEDRYHREERNLIEWYEKEVPVSQAVRRVLKLVYYVHHCGIRTRQVTQQVLDTRKNELRRLLTIAHAWL